MTFDVYLGLGTNLGNKKENLATAIALIEQTLGEVQKVSSIYFSAAWGIENQPDFLNQVVLIKTKLFPLKLIEKILEIENKMGRTRRVKWGERLIDIDILLIDTILIHTPQLTVPHPFILQRSFVITPLIEIASNILHPIYQKTLGQLHEDCTDSTTLYRLEP